MGLTTSHRTASVDRLSRSAAVFAVVSLLALAAAASAAATSSGVMAWGHNGSGQLGDGTAVNSFTPVAPTGLGDVTAVAANGFHSMALLGNGSVMSWGGDLYGTLGNGTIATDSEVPVAVTGLTGATGIAAGDYFDVALLGNGTVAAWGESGLGQLGNGNATGPLVCHTLPCSTTPVIVHGLTGVRAVAAGGDHALALMSDGTVQAWGSNLHGPLGDGTWAGPELCGLIPCSTTPVPVSHLSGVVAIAAGLKFSLALLADGRVMAWGDNPAGQLGNGTIGAFSDVPVEVRGLSGVSAIAAGGGHALALMANGTVMAWGHNTSGQLGDGTIINRALPAPVAGLTGVAKVAAGRAFSMALLNDGHIMAWGNNQYGQLGDGNTSGPSRCEEEACSRSPVPVSGISQARGIAGGYFHALAFGEPLPTVASVSVRGGPTSGGTSVTITGANLAGASAVHFGAIAASSFTVTSPTTVVAVSPPQPSGTVDVTVTTPAGTSPAKAADQFGYGTPTVSEISPRIGPLTGGTTVVIDGSGLGEATEIDFGTTPAISFSVSSATSITAVAPPQAAAGPVDVTVKTPQGTSPDSEGDGFSYTPTVASVEPLAGSPLGGTRITVTGTGFALGARETAFRFGSVPATEVNCTSTTRCSLVTPPNAAGILDVTALVETVSSPENQLGGEFTYL